MTFLNDVVVTVNMVEIPAELILNWDQTGIIALPPQHGQWKSVVQSVLRWFGVNDKHIITSFFLMGNFLPV